MHGQLQDQVLGLRAAASTRFFICHLQLDLLCRFFCHGAAEEKVGAAYGRCAWWPASQSPRIRCAAHGWSAGANILPRSAPCHLGTESPTSPSSKLSLYVALFSVQQLQVLIEAIDQFTSAVNTQLALRLPGVCNGVVVFPSHAVLIDVPH